MRTKLSLAAGADATAWRPRARRDPRLAVPRRVRVQAKANSRHRLSSMWACGSHSHCLLRGTGHWHWHTVNLSVTAFVHRPLSPASLLELRQLSTALLAILPYLRGCAGASYIHAFISPHCCWHWHWRSEHLARPTQLLTPML